jgi:hypothetical protein
MKERKKNSVIINIGQIIDLTQKEENSTHKYK